MNSFDTLIGIPLVICNIIKVKKGKKVRRDIIFIIVDLYLNDTSIIQI